MSFQLNSVLRLDGSNFIRNMNRVQRATEQANRAAGLWRDNQNRLRNSLGQYAASASSATNANNRFGSSLRNSLSGIGRLRGGLGGLTTGLLGVAGAFAAINASKKIMDQTLGEAMKYEMSSVTVDAMFNSKKIGKQYRDMVEKIAIESPILESQELLSSSRGFITKSKDLKTLEKMVKITEKLAAYDPIQGTKGASFSLNELMSGDPISLQERFELSRTDLKPIKDIFKGGDIAKGLDAFDKYLEKIGITNKLITEMGNTSAGKLAQVREQFAMLFRKMGEPSLNVVSQFFDKIITKLESGELDRFANVGASWIKSILTGLTNGVMSVYEWFNNLTSSSEFQSKTTLLSKVLFVFDDIWARFMNWVQGGGQGQIDKITKDVLELLSAGLIMNQQIIVDTALIIGKAVGSAMASAAGDAFAGWAHKAMTESSLFNNKWLPGLKPFKWAMDAGMKLRENVKGKKAAGPQDYNSITNRITRQVPKRNGGLNYVRNDGDTFSLHRGEMILPRGEADNYRKGKTGGNNVNITLNYQGTSNLREDAKKLLELFANEIERAGGAGA